MPIYFKGRVVTVPGELLAEGSYKAGGFTYFAEGRIYAAAVGLAEFKGGREVQVIPLKGCYIPRVGDMVIGHVVDYTLNRFIVDINSIYKASLQTSGFLDKPIDLTRESIRKYYDVGDLIVAKVASFDLTREPTLTVRERGLGRIRKGRIVEMTPAKVPRLIGRRGSMINMIKKDVGRVDIIVGQNGRILISAGKLEVEDVIIEAIRKIELESHTKGLTNRVHEFIVKELARRRLR